MTHAPDFTLPDQDNITHSLSDYHGQWLVLYFYPMDDTPGCTKEACSFRDARTDIEKQAAVVGVSTDSVASHKSFSDKYHLGFTLLSDPSHEVINTYQAWSGSGTMRTTFIISPNGTIAKRYDDVDPGQHAEMILRDLARLSA